ncbi:MAG TPA: DUF2203 family protein [Myxococcota bacterium]|jgi:hypothetical protein|nr:DUF2203 family protein [Myxococcota bacterium]
MKQRTYALKDAERIVPLLRSIGREIKARRRAAEEMRKHLDVLRTGPRAEGGAQSVEHLEAQIAVHLREMRSAEIELERLGCRLDVEHPLRILIPSPNGDWAFDGHLEDTRFYVSRSDGAPSTPSTSS